MTYVVKVEGKAHGKGVLVTESYFEAMKAISEHLREGRRVVAERVTLPGAHQGR